MGDRLTQIIETKRPFCIIQKQDAEDVFILEGEALQFDRIDDIPRQSGVPPLGKSYDTISMIPFSQIREKGYQARNDGEQVLTLKIERFWDLPLADLLAKLTYCDISLENGFEYDMTTAEYETLIQKIVEDEIGNGEGANFVIPRTLTGRITDFSTEKALSIFKYLLENDYGTYWKFIFYNGSSYFIGSTPERHLFVEDRKVKMNPISGTFRKDKTYQRRTQFKADLLGFLNHPKEINELFMVVDEELKMMSRMCEQGGAIIGPLLKEMSKLIHSEYLLSGESDKDVIELFKDSMYAATVTGSPVENACNIILKYGKHSRRYYGSAILLLGRDENGGDTLDSPITIRTLEVDTSGQFQSAVGATLVRDSIASEEVLETEAKSAALLASIVAKGKQELVPPLLSRLANDDEIVETLQFRNQYLSNFWFFKQETRLHSEFDNLNIKITIIHNGDDFVYMLRHIFKSFGMQTTIVPYKEYNLKLDQSAITLVGPGPGNPNQVEDPKMQTNYAIVDALLSSRKPSLFICLGHQFLCSRLGYTIARKKVPLQGVQEKIRLFGREERVGFYNTFVPLNSDLSENHEKSLAMDQQEMLAIRGDFFVGFQFHPESILTKNGDAILKEAIAYLLR
ncbi:MAG: chorismate-binding protein [SAR324 cluster bacterium]|nr:chorismate-binding protein [SAR324 cluster bacterium]